MSPLQPSRRWPSLVAFLAIAAISFALPENLSFGPAWLLPILVGILVLPTVWSHRRGAHKINQIFGFTLSAIQTTALIWSVFMLVATLPSHRESPIELLHAALGLWISNVLVFALWYWRLDAGGPHQRETRAAHRQGSFQFPQMTLHEGDSNFDAHWTPDFLDYLFLAFNTSTALSPTDSPVFGRWAKVLMMTQALISLVILAILAARAVNVL